MGNYYFLGIDVSKRNLDCCLFCNGVVVRQDVILNYQKSIEKYLFDICVDQDTEPDCLVICAEYTGMYIYPLIVACQSKDYKLWIEDPHK